jgi:lipopolysaccharide export system permease protein
VSQISSLQTTKDKNRFFRNLVWPWLLDRYVIAALIPPFLFGVGIFSTIGIAVGVVFDLVSQLSEVQIPMEVLLQLLLLQAPYFIGFAFPMAMLLASLLAFSRLSADSEVVAMRSVGVSIYRLLLPAMVFGMLVSLLTFTFNEAMVPQARYQAAQLLDQTLRQEQSNLQAKNLFYPEYGPDQEIKRLFYARQFDGQRLMGLTILDLSQKDLEQVSTAESATWSPGISTWKFVNGTLYLVSADGSYRSVLQFNEQEIKIPRDALKNRRTERNESQMTLAEARQHLQQLRQGGDMIDIRKLELEIQRRYAIPFQGLTMSLIGAAMALRPQRNRSARGFGISIVVIFSYYLLAFITNALGTSGALTPVLSAWSPGLLGLAIAFGLILRANR